ncbi:MAG TPA: sensory rhodopsin transducer [Longimicrobiaceae bacterium]|nr:sensory rhodopsin transducer [Longimicrobiaceae bacterium]
MASGAIGRRKWAIADGYIPAWSHGPEPEMLSHEACCILNTAAADAEVEITLYFEDRDPVGPYRFTVPARRTSHLRFNQFEDPEPIPLGVGYAAVVVSSIPVVVQQTRLDSRQSENGLFSTMAFPLD